jgi:GNAT superfamily N-acetyltransferase
MEKVVCYRQGDFLITTDPRKINKEAVCSFLAKTYWARWRPKEVIIRSLEHSLCFSLFYQKQQIGLGRAVTDYATFAYLCDLYVDEQFRGQGLGTWLLECILDHPELKDVNWCLLTGTAHDFYRQFGFRSLRKPQHYMEKRCPWPN